MGGRSGVFSPLQPIIDLMDKTDMSRGKVLRVGCGSIVCVLPRGSERSHVRSFCAVAKKPDDGVNLLNRKRLARPFFLFALAKKGKICYTINR